MLWNARSQGQVLGPSQLDSALLSCRAAFGLCAVFSLLINLLMLASPIYLLQVYDRVLTTGHIDTLIMITMLVTLALAVMCALDAVRTAINIRIGCWLTERLGPIFLGCGIRGRLDGQVAGAQSLHDIGQIQSFIATQGLTAFFDSPWVPLFIALIWILHPLLGAVAVAAAGALLLLSLANEIITRKSTQAANEIQLQSFRLADACIRNAEVVAAMGMLPVLTERWAGLNHSMAGALRRAGDAGGLVLATTKFARFFVQVAILGLGAWLVLNAQLTTGGMIAASILLGRALAPVELAIGAWRKLMGARFAYARLRQIMDEYPAEPARTRLPAPTGRVAAQELTFIAPNTGQLILNKVSFAVEPGEALAILGPSGAGKSTLCRLLVGLEKPTVGEPDWMVPNSIIGTRPRLGASLAFCPKISSCLPARSAKMSPGCKSVSMTRSCRPRCWRMPIR